MMVIADIDGRENRPRQDVILDYAILDMWPFSPAVHGYLPMRAL